MLLWLSKNIHKYTLIMLMTILTFQYCLAQDDSRPFVFVQVDWMHSDPLDRFSDLLNHEQLNGLEFSVLRQFKNYDAWFVGLSLSSATIDKVTQGIFTAKSGYWDYSAVIRHYPGIGFWRVDPYVQVFGGLRRLTTVTSIEISEDEREFNTEEKANTPIYGLGIGATVMLGRTVHLNLSSAFQASGATTYLIAISDTYSPPLENFEEVFSITNTMRYQIGLTFQF